MCVSHYKRFDTVSEICAPQNPRFEVVSLHSHLLVVLYKVLPQTSAPSAMWTNSKWEEDLYDLEKNWVVVNSKFSDNVILLPGNISQSNPCAIQNCKCLLDVS